MNTNELMLGDYVHSDRFNENCIVTDLDEYCVWLLVGDHKSRHHANEISPIPLTDEIMKKNFPDDEPGYGILWMVNNDGSVSVDYTDLNENIIILPTVRYFHELQHILHLVGSSKTIEP